MGTPKTDALALIEKMPDDCTWDQIAYRVYMRARIEQGLADFAAGRVTPHEEVKAEVDQWLASLGRTTPSSASAKSLSGSVAIP